MSEIKTYRAWIVPEHGGIDVLKLEERELKNPGPGEVRIKTASGALNHLDLWVRRGVPGHKFPIPMIPMSDVCGTVDAVGEGVTSRSVGERVVLMPGVVRGDQSDCAETDDPLSKNYRIRGEGMDGGAAEYIYVPHFEAIPIPDTMDWDTAAAFGLTFMTAYRMVFTRGKIRHGDWVLVHAAGSGVSIAAIQLARMGGGKIIATAGSAEKIDKARELLPVDHIINYKEADYAKEIRDITGKRGIDLIIDHVGRDTFDANIKLLAKGGRMVTCGNTSGPFCETNLAMVFFKGLSILGSTMGARREFLACLDLVGRGLVKPIVDSVYPFEKLPQAHERLESRNAFGKVLLRME